jgi:AcrR family transcriptional regulator
LIQILSNGYCLRVPPRRLNLSAVLDEAIEVVDRHGFDALSLSSVATELGVGPSALYTHLDGLEALRYLVAVRATDNLATAVRSAAIGTAGDAALDAMGTAYRRFALDRPGQFASTLLPPRSDDDDLARANRALDDIFVLVYTAMGLGAPRAHLAARSTRCAIHGFLALEHTAGTTPVHEAEYRFLLDVIRLGLRDDVTAA